MELERQKVEPEVPSSHTHSPTPSSYQEIVLSALSNPVILDSVFGNLDLESLKKCREVCSKWSEIANPFLHPDCVIRIGDTGRNINEGYKVHQLVDLEGVNLPCGVKFEIRKSGSNLPQILDKIKGMVKRLELNMDYEDYFERLGNPDPECQELLSQIQLPYLKSLSVRLWSGAKVAKVKEYTIALLEIIKRAPNLQELHIRQGYDERPKIFWDTLLGPEGLGGNQTVLTRLDTLSLSFDEWNLETGHIEALRKLNLKLKKLTLELDDADFGEELILTDGRKKQFAALSIWIKDLSSSLESCSFINGLDTPLVSKRLKFLTEMKVLTNLEIIRLEMFGNGFLRQLKLLPKLEKFNLKLGHLKAEELDECSFPNVKELTFWTYECEDLHFRPFFIPKIFPSLKKLSMSVFSKNIFLSVIHDLKGMMIEELELRLGFYPEPEDNYPYEKIGGDVAWGWDVPSLASWKGLRKLELRYRVDDIILVMYEDVKVPLVHHDSSMIHAQVYNMPLESILPGSLISLILNNLEKVDADFLVKLVKGLPILMHLDMCGGSVVDKSGKLMKRSVLMDKIGNQSLISPNLSICNIKCAPEDASNSTNKEDTD